MTGAGSTEAACPGVLVDLTELKRKVRSSLGPAEPLRLVLERTADQVPATEMRSLIPTLVTLAEAA